MNKKINNSSNYILEVDPIEIEKKKLEVLTHQKEKNMSRMKSMKMSSKFALKVELENRPSESEETAEEDEENEEIHEAC